MRKCNNYFSMASVKSSSTKRALASERSADADISWGTRNFLTKSNVCDAVTLESSQARVAFHFTSTCQLVKPNIISWNLEENWEHFAVPNSSGKYHLSLFRSLFGHCWFVLFSDSTFRPSKTRVRHETISETINEVFLPSQKNGKRLEPRSSLITGDIRVLSSKKFT